MKFYMAPMEGITGYVFRNAYEACFGNVDTYFSPFIISSRKRSLKSRELKDILPENNQKLHLVPQILSNDAKAFLHTCKEMEYFGYQEVNLNLGCPAKTVVSKGRGSGFLAKERELDEFLDAVFSQVKLQVSVKTRIGIEFPSEFSDLLAIFNKYPIKELIVHPRTQQEFYKGKPHMEIFREAVDNSRQILCYNGDIFSKSDYENIRNQFPDISSVMIGRGILRNPGLVDELKGEPPLTRDKLRQFHDCVYDGYRCAIDGERNVLYKMKELWCYMGDLFSDHKKPSKKIKKAQKLFQYEEGVREMFQCEL